LEQAHAGIQFAEVRIGAFRLCPEAHLHVRGMHPSLLELHGN
jgi:hypothetical protein